MSDTTDTPEFEPQDLTEDQTEDQADDNKAVWMRGLFMLILAGLFWLAQGLMFAAAVLQFGWLLFAKEKNQNIAGFGAKLADWQASASRFLSGATEDKPFPWAKWG